MKTFPFAILTLIVHLSYSQITPVSEENKAKEIGSAGTVTLSFIESENYYFFTYKNWKYQTLNDYESVGFKETGSDLDNLFEVFQSLAKKEGPQNIDLNFDKAIVRISKDGWGNYTLTVVPEVGVSSYTQPLSKKQLSQIFNRDYVKSDWK